MIRINLLPVRAAKKKERIRFQLTVAGLAIFLVVAVMAAIYITASSESKNIRADIGKGEAELAALKGKIGELSRIKEQKRIVEEKLTIIRNLDAARTGPTELFAKIAGAIPEKAWINSMQDLGYMVKLNGYAATDEVVAEFMRGLGKHRDLGRVELEIAQRMNDPVTNTDVVNFVIRLEKQR
jgi:type IV pilus assembly protein PilN